MKNLIRIIAMILFSFANLSAQEINSKQESEINFKNNNIPQGSSLVGMGLDILQVPIGVLSAEFEFAAGRSSSVLLSPKAKPLAIYEESRFVAIGMEYRKYLLIGKMKNKWMQGLYISAYGSAKYFPSLSLPANDGDNWKRSTAVQIGALIGTKKQFSNGMYLGVNTGLVYRSRLIHNNRSVVSSRGTDNYVVNFRIGEDIAEKVIMFRGVMPKFGLKVGVAF